MTGCATAEIYFHFNSVTYILGAAGPQLWASCVVASIRVASRRAARRHILCEFVAGSYMQK